MITRRTFLASSIAAAALPGIARLCAENASDLHLARFAFDVSPPVGHSLCGGWIQPVVDYDDRLEALGFVLLGAGDPIVICAVDWTGILNSAHIAWRTALAEAAHTTPERVAVQCVHQHNAPFVCLDAERIVAAHPELPPIVDVDFFQRCLDQARVAVKVAIERARPVTHLAVGQAQVERIAGNRRFIGADGKVEDWRGSGSTNPKHKELPEGLIDPWLKTVAFYENETKVAACHYYATHPMSYYGDGRVSSDFAGLARKALQAAEPDCQHLYFTGCAGNIAAGKYNDGTPAARKELTERLLAALCASQANLQPQRIEHTAWITAPIQPPPRHEFAAEEIEEQINNRDNQVVNRNRPAFTLAWLQRCQQQIPIVLSALRINQVSMLHLPAECFVEYQLYAQQQASDQFVATAAYGDGGPWYVPTADAYPQGGYEVGVAFCDPEVDQILRTGIDKLIS